MTKKELQEAMKSRGFDVKPYTIDYAVSVGHVTTPEKSASGDRVYTETQLEELVTYLTIPRRSASTSKNAAAAS